MQSIIPDSRSNPLFAHSSKISNKRARHYQLTTDELREKMIDMVKNKEMSIFKVYQISVINHRQPEN